MAIIPILILSGLLLPVGILLQIYLSKRGKWLGLILPTICLMFSLLIVCNLVVFTGNTSTVLTDGNGVVIGGQHNEHFATTAEVIGTVLPPFLLFNIPTVILLGIYGAARADVRKKDQLNKMSIQDLE